MAHPLYQDSIIAFVDILGWSELLRTNRLHDILLAVHFIEAAAQGGRDRRNLFKKNRWSGGSKTRVSYFSDTVVLSCPSESLEAGWMISEVQSLCLGLLGFGRYTRGAIVRGNLRHRKTILFGPALVDAHEIEKSVAKYPRLVVTSEAAPFVNAATHPRDHPRPTDPQWSRDADGLMFLELFSRRSDGLRLDYHQVTARALLDRIQGELLLETNLIYAANHGWMVRYLESVIAAQARDTNTPKRGSPSGSR